MVRGLLSNMTAIFRVLAFTVASKPTPREPYKDGRSTANQLPQPPNSNGNSLSPAIREEGLSGRYVPTSLCPLHPMPRHFAKHV
ncbi:hypothetical protein BD309DRAFT_1014030 [Dichomitus squalens]|nr:hypothetical protein BD309DRAFT_1014030 [Dichomitus squalens]